MRLAESAKRLEPRTALLALLLIQICAIVALALSAPHDGWLWYQGGDQLWHWVGAWLMSDGVLPPAEVGYVWSLVLLPLAAAAGPSFLSGAPALVILQPLVLVPLATVLVYAAGARIAGRWFGVWAASVWAFGPFLAIPLFVARYHDRWVEQFLPQLGGLSGLSDLPATVCVVAAALAALRALDRPEPLEGAIAGVLAGLAVGVKPSNALFVAAPLAAFAAARFWRPAAAFAVALLPTVATLAIWKLRGLGELPAFAFSATTLVAPGDLLAANPLTRYVDFDWGQLHANMDQLREFFWSARLLQWAPIAGGIALARRSLPHSILISAWFWAYLIGKGTAGVASVESGSFWRLLMPALPAYALLLAALPLLVPGLGGRIAALPRPVPRVLPRRTIAIATAAAVLLPLGAVSLLRPLGDTRAIQLQTEGTLVPVVDELALEARRTGDRLALSWRAPDTGSSYPFYRLFRSEAEELYCFDAGVQQCILHAEPFDTVEGTRQTVPFRPGTYRLGMVANWRREKGMGETLLLGPPLVIR